MSYHQKYLKYKNKYLDLKKTQIMKGGLLEIDYNYKNITSFGFEFEFGELMPFTGIEDPDNKILTLTPFGYNENSLDDTQNRSVRKFLLQDIVADGLVGEFLLTQDSYDILGSEESNQIDLKKMNVKESLTKRLHKYNETFELDNASEGLTYDKIKFNVNIGKNLTIGDTEFVCTFKQAYTDEFKKNDIFNINTCTHKIIDRLKKYLSSDSTFIGKFNISYTHYFYENGKKESDTKNEDYDLFKINFGLDDPYINTYMLVKSSIIYDKKNMYDYLLCAPQITLGVPIKEVKNVIFTINKYRYYDNNDNIDDIDATNKLAEKLVNDTIFKLNNRGNNNKLKLINNNVDNLLNYLFFYYLYIEVDYIKDYAYKNKDVKSGNLDINKYLKMGTDLTISKYLTIHKYAKSYLPRQHFHEILEKTPELLDCVKIVYYNNFNFILLYRIHYLKWIISGKKIKIPDLNNLNNLSDESNESIRIRPNFYENYYWNSHIKEKFDSFIKLKLIFSDDDIKYIASILICDMKMFIGIKNGENDQITSFTTRIPYDRNHILFEYRMISSSTNNNFKKTTKYNRYNDILTLNNIEFILNKHKSNFLYKKLLEKHKVLYNNLKINRKQEEMKNLNIFLQDINKDIFYTYQDILDESHVEQ